jgi:hypothetical protein
VLTSKQLDALVSQGCGVAGCHCMDDPMYLEARCHLRGRLNLVFNVTNVSVVASCSVCRKLVADIAISSKEVLLEGKDKVETHGCNRLFGYSAAYSTSAKTLTLQCEGCEQKLALLAVRGV